MLSDTVAVARTTVSPNCRRQAPAACLASRPDSSFSGRPANVRSTCFTMLPVQSTKKYARRPGALAGTPSATPVALVAETQLVDELPIALQVGALQVFQQAPALADHPEEAALPVEILGVDPEVIGEAVDPLGEQRDLDRG